MLLLGLDVGEKRIGVAKADSSVRIAVPVGMLPVDGTEFERLIRFVKIQNTDVIVVGMPRNLQGEETRQSAFVRDFVKTLNKSLLAARPNNKVVKIFLQDESLTSVEARNNLKHQKGGINKKAGDVDAEAATLILQDFLENLERRLRQSRPAASPSVSAPSSASSVSSATPASTPASSPAAPSSKTSQTQSRKTQFDPYQKTQVKKWLALRIFLIFLACLTLVALGLKFTYDRLLTAVVSPETCSETASEDSEVCQFKDLTIEDGSSVETIAEALKSAGLIRNPFVFKLYNRLSGTSAKLQAGTYRLAPTLSVSELVDKLVEGPGKGIVFRFTVLPGETLSDVKKRLATAGYSDAEITAALEKNYNHPVLKSKPANASLEGYLFGETYEFYTTDSVETIIIRMLDELYRVVQKNNLESKFNSLGLTLHEGIILASVVQKEAGTLDKEDQKTVAQVFLSRLELGIPLGSDVTVKYALDLVDPERKTYTDNAAALEIDSCYNTRKNAGLPCGPISSPGSLVLISTANPSDTSYLYFLTGDDGKMYYSNTESEHLSNVSAYCSELCQTQL
ncbi:endolytic transglycosylase MltG [Candidatus Saccharibacteria bacterium]|nr:endolytic transglycosylase MltG [Candidatus Saccharibacteria bacterium]